MNRIDNKLLPATDSTEPVTICVLLDSSGGARHGDDGEDVHHRGAGDRFRHRRQRGVWARAGAAGVWEVELRRRPPGRLRFLCT